MIPIALPPRPFFLRGMARLLQGSGGDSELEGTSVAPGGFHFDNVSAIRPLVPPRLPVPRCERPRSLFPPSHSFLPRISMKKPTQGVMYQNTPASTKLNSIDVSKLMHQGSGPLADDIISSQPT